MEIQKEILDNLNQKYVLLKQNDDYIIIDKNRRTMVVIDDPIIDFQELINTMIKNKVEIFKNPNDLPPPKETLISHQTIPSSYKLFIKKLYDNNSNETGAIISALTNKGITKTEKQKIEKRIENYVFTVLYPREGVNLYSDVNSDTASITVIKGINNLPYKDLGDLYDW